MSSAKKSDHKVGTGARYTDSQKKEILNFIEEYNAKNGRGGQSTAVKKYKVTPLTIGAWLKKAGSEKGAAKAVKVEKVAKEGSVSKGAKAVKIVKAAKNSVKPGLSTRGVRYTPSQKQEVVDFVLAYNSANGRGGQSKAAEKFGLSVLTVSACLKGVGLSAKTAGPKIAKAGKAGKAAKAGKVAKSAKVASGDTDKKVASLLSLSDQIRKAERAIDSLRSKYDAVRASI
jgi:hypothetical protein